VAAFAVASGQLVNGVRLCDRLSAAVVESFATWSALLSCPSQSAIYCPRLLLLLLLLYHRRRRRRHR
jgi:hypothetical protein